MVASLKTAISNTPQRRKIDSQVAEHDRVKEKVERYALLLRGAPTAITLSALVALVTLWVAWGKVAPAVIIGWTSAVVALSALRLAIWLQYRRRSHAPRTLLKFARFHVVFMGINGVLFGALAPIFAVNDMLGHAFLPFVVAGMSAAAIASASSSWRAVSTFNLPVLTSLAVSYVFFLGLEGVGVALVVALYGVATAFLAASVQTMVVRAIRLRSRNENLYATLKREMNAVNEAEQRYRALVEVSNDLTLIFSPEGRITYASPAVERIFSVRPRAVVGRLIKDIVHPDDFKTFREVGGKALAGLGDAKPVSHVCMRVGEGDYAVLSGRITNMLYVPGVEGFVFNGGVIAGAARAPCPAVAV